MQALLALGDYQSTDQEKGKLVVDDEIPVHKDSDLRNENTEYDILQVNLKKKQKDKQDIEKISTRTRRRQTQTKICVDEPGWQFHENPTMGCKHIDAMPGILCQK